MVKPEYHGPFHSPTRSFDFHLWAGGMMMGPVVTVVYTKVGNLCRAPILVGNVSCSAMFDIYWCCCEIADCDLKDSIDERQRNLFSQTKGIWQKLFKHGCLTCLTFGFWGLLILTKSTLNQNCKVLTLLVGKVSSANVNRTARVASCAHLQPNSLCYTWTAL